MGGDMNLFHNPVEYPQKRLFCLDLLRGIDMFYLSVVSVILPPLFSLAGVHRSISAFFVEHPWGGFSLYDLIMPLFIFMAGAAIPLSLGRRLKNGRATWDYWKHVFIRVVMLWILGMFVQGSLEKFNLHHISPYNNTLQTIAFGYLVSSGVMLLKNRYVKLAIPIALAVMYGVIVHFCGSYTKDGNITMIVELKILNAILPADNTQTANVVKYGYTWFLPSMIFPVMTLSGCFSTEILMSKLSQLKKAVGLTVFGLISLGAGWMLVFAGVPSIKQFYTVSFTLQAIGWSVLLLAVLYVLTDIFKFRRGTGLLLLFGQYALTAYICLTIFRGPFVMIWKRFTIGLYDLFPTTVGPILSAVGYSLVTVVVLVLYRFLKSRRADNRER
jgi:predicted acyltransferase